MFAKQTLNVVIVNSNLPVQICVGMSVACVVLHVDSLMTIEAMAVDCAQRDATDATADDMKIDATDATSDMRVVCVTRDYLVAARGTCLAYVPSRLHPNQVPSEGGAF
jgi:hypothetical protein